MTDADLQKCRWYDVAHRDLHKPYADNITLVSAKGKKMFREPDLIDVWFDSGAMPYAQWHYPFENKEKVDSGTAFPADFISFSGGWTDRRASRLCSLQTDRPVHQSFLLPSVVDDLSQRGIASSGRVGHSDSGDWRTDRRGDGEVWIVENQGTRDSGGDGSGAGQPQPD